MRERNYQTCLTSLIADRRHSLFGHICCLPENAPASQALQLLIEAHTGTPPAADWKRLPGHPRRNWLQQVEEDIGLSVGAAWIAGQDRSTWRTLRPSAGHLCSRLNPPGECCVLYIKLSCFIYFLFVYGYMLELASFRNVHTTKLYYVMFCCLFVVIALQFS